MLTKANLQQRLKAILAGMDDADTDDFDWYMDLMVEGIDDDDIDDIFDDGIEETLAREAIKHPELHDIIAQIVTKIIEINEPDDAVSINEEQAAGACFAAALALNDVKYIQLLAQHYQSGDPDHTESEYYEEYITEILDKYGWSRDIYPVIFAMNFVRSQHRGEFFTEEHAEELAEHLKQNDNLSNFFTDLIEWTTKYDHDKHTFKEMIYLLSDAFDVDYENDIDVAEAAARFEQAIKSGKIPTISEINGANN